MATRIIEYGSAVRRDELQAIPFGVVTQAPITASSTSQQSAAFGADTTMICIDTDEAVHEARGTNPTATTSNLKVRAGTYEFFTVNPGQKVAIIVGT